MKTTFRRRVARTIALAVTSLLLLGACVSEPERDVQPRAAAPSERVVISALDAVAQSRGLSTDDAPEQLASVGDNERTDLISSVAPAGDEPAGPELDATPNELLAWEWQAHALEPIAQFMAILIPGTPDTEPEWPFDLTPAGDTAASACVDGDDYAVARAAFGNGISQTFEHDGRLWQLTVVDPRTGVGIVSSC